MTTSNFADCFKIIFTNTLFVVDEERTIGMRNYSGLLYTYRESESRVVLRTPALSFLTEGLQEPEMGTHDYICVASHSGLTESRIVEVVPTGK